MTFKNHSHALSLKENYEFGLFWFLVGFHRHSDQLQPDSYSLFCFSAIAMFGSHPKYADLCTGASWSPLALVLHFTVSICPAAQLWPAHICCCFQPNHSSMWLWAASVTGQKWKWCSKWNEWQPNSSSVSTPTKQIWKLINSVHSIDLNPYDVVNWPVVFFN